jgi:hypothetical protein
MRGEGVSAAPVAAPTPSARFSAAATAAFLALAFVLFFMFMRKAFLILIASQNRPKRRAEIQPAF